MMNENKCVMCGESIPEGTQVCPACEKKTAEMRRKTCSSCSHYRGLAHKICTKPSSPYFSEKRGPEQFCVKWESKKKRWQP